jgi:ATP-binding cassette, subfamily B, bacterial PglK
MLNVVKKILFLLTKKERRQLLWLSMGIMLMAILEVAGIASIMPFMAVVSNPEVIETNQWINLAFQIGGFNSTNGFLIFLGFVVLFIIIISNAFKATMIWLENKFVFGVTCNMSQRLFSHYLNQPFSFFLNHNTQILGKNFLMEVIQFVGNVLKPTTEIFSKLVVALFIFILLLYVDPLLTIIIIAVLGFAYYFLYSLVQRKLERLGKERFDANSQRFKIAGEAFGGIKDLKVLGRESFFLDNFSIHAKQVAKTVTVQQTISQLPRFVMEALSFGGILVIILYFLMIRGSVGQSLPIIALYAFAGYRLMPSLQSIFSSATTLRFNIAVIDSIRESFSEMNEERLHRKFQSLDPLPIHDEIRLDNITFNYPGNTVPVIEDLNLTFKKNVNVGFVGATGSGKTTTVDIILGLLKPQKGCLKIDGIPLTPKNLQRWQLNLGYVPQHIFLCDDTVAANIAFGISPAEIDMNAVARAARIANLHDFVITELPKGYLTEVGERGVRLSGGQRQRIGIARALYHNPEVLIMDEATSSLDGITEESVIQAIRNLAGKKTIITIAHRLTTLRDCEVIYVMDKGRIVEQGAFEDLSRTSTRFKAMGRPGSMSAKCKESLNQRRNI